MTAEKLTARPGADPLTSAPGAVDEQLLADVGLRLLPQK